MMRSVVFVRDALGVPLLPTTPVHAKRLVTQGRATYLPHPSLTLLQRGPYAPASACAPVLLSISMREPSVQFCILVKQRRRAYPLIRCSVPWQLPPGIDPPHAAPVAPGPAAAAYLMQAIAAVQTLLPITHLQILAAPAPALSTAHPLPHWYRTATALGTLLLHARMILLHELTIAALPAPWAIPLHACISGAAPDLPAYALVPLRTDPVPPAAGGALAPSVWIGSVRRSRHPTARVHYVTGSSLVESGSHARIGWVPTDQAGELGWYPLRIPAHTIHHLERVHDTLVLPVVTDAGGVRATP